MSSNTRNTATLRSQSGFWRRAPAFTPTEVDFAFSSDMLDAFDEPATLLPFKDQTDMVVSNPTTEQPQSISPNTADPKDLSTQPEHQESTDPGDSAEVNSIGSPVSSGKDPLMQKYHAVLSAANIDLEQLQKLSWKGIPAECRGTSWRLLMGYLPLNASRRELTVQRKRKEYDDWVGQTFSRGEDSLDRTLWHQIRIDVPRTTPGSPIFQSQRIQRSLERVLYCWAARHPASGYVQGINDLLTPFYYVFIQQHLPQISQYASATNTDSNASALETLLGSLDDKSVSAIEADSFWCLTKLLDGIQDNYTHAQPGIQRQIVKLKELVARIDGPLAAHLDSEGVEFIQFAFRWCNCLLMREMNLASTIRMWDTYLAEPNGFSDFHTYVCAAFLLKWSAELRKLDFQKIMMFLQSPPTESWGVKDVELLLSEAYMYKCLYHNSPSHYSTGNSSGRR
ncbi:GTPase-activating protein [Coemansia sp. RSA 2049]|nr:GTPase-activating protein [Coemansia sp. RSA 2049]KAJ2521802.1 GTPase-activating protein [Coemansia sp. RSA 1939]KAJ2610486.1 GTPase-activating protein [Coemansia sp. RSA 1804]KAJ2686120.1 GTPase-activating protein [Coemansia sp. RSA 1285]